MFENVWLVATALDIFTEYSKVLMTLCWILRQENSIFPLCWMVQQQVREEGDKSVISSDAFHPHSCKI